MDLAFCPQHVSHRDLTLSLACDALERTYHKVISGWFPADDAVFDCISTKLNNGRYENNRDELLHDLKTDVSIYLYLLRQLSLNFKNSEPHEKVEPTELLRGATLEQIKDCLSVSRATVSPHSFVEISEASAWRLKQSLSCAATTELLAESLELDATTGFSCGLMRQLGLTLIAWNFPHIYERAEKKVSKNLDLDTCLKQVLGFYPMALGVQYARECNFCDEVLSSFSGSAFSGSELVEGGVVASKEGLDLYRVCEIAQTFVELSDPEHYPEAHRYLVAIQENIERILGPDCSELIQAKTSSYWRHYENHMPEEVKSDITRSNKLPEILSSDFDPEYIAQLMRGNPYLAFCNVELRDALIGLYYKMREGEVVRENLEALFHQVVPENGFRGACVFMIDSTQERLVPLMKIGAIDASILRPVSIVRKGLLAAPIAAAFETKMPHVYQDDSLDEGSPICISGSIGKYEQIGVLYLELPVDFRQRKKTEPLAAFKAIRECLIASLGLPG